MLIGQDRVKRQFHSHHSNSTLTAHNALPLSICARYLHYGQVYPEIREPVLEFDIIVTALLGVHDMDFIDLL